MIPQVLKDLFALQASLRSPSEPPAACSKSACSKCRPNYRYTHSLYLADGKPHATVTAVKYLGGRLIRPDSKSSGWVLAPEGMVLHDTEAEARSALIAEVDVLMAHLENIRASLVKKT